MTLRRLVLATTLAACAAGPLRADPFADGLTALTNRQPAVAARLMELQVATNPGPGVWNNLGLAHWKQGDTGRAILAWERARAVNPYAAAPRENLAFARKFAQLREPALTWYEMCSTWLPAGLWPWLAAVGFWLAAVLFLLPGTLGWRRRDWHQSVAALGITLFLVALPGVWGAWSRTRFAVVTQPGAALRLTPTAAGQTVTPLGAGELVRLGRTHRSFVLVTWQDDVRGWIDTSHAAPIHGR